MASTLPQRSDVQPAPIRLAVVDPSPVVLEAVSLFLESQPDLEVVVRAQTGEQALDRLNGMRRGGVVALVAMELSGPQDAYWVIHAIREQCPSVRIAAFGAVFDRMSISKALFVGADGFIDKRANPIQFLDAIRRTVRGELVLAGVPREWLGPIANGLEDGGGAPAALTAREIEILSVAAEGLTAKEIALRMGLASRTVTTHLANIYSKLGVGTRVAAVMKAANLGLIDIDSMSPPGTPAVTG
jgi:two-component system, NarL family, response regulator DevR